ncbi:unnamed protein product [Anisakis simplex]|uniref:Uncharacterized protein n=1 Tax=Anisakis simplex TaxID=6269 RepID=A0A0M3K1D1_ANISI|nr:unnamed protein product [Anisakis simplex]
MNKRDDDARSHFNSITSCMSNVRMMFGARTLQRRNFILNILSIVGAYWIISTLVSLNNITEKLSPELKTGLDEKVVNDEKVVHKNNDIERKRVEDDKKQIEKDEKVDEKINEENEANADEDQKEEKSNNLEENEKPNIPQPDRRFYKGDSPIYRYGDPNQAGELGKPVVIDKEVHRLFISFQKIAFNSKLLSIRMVYADIDHL